MGDKKAAYSCEKSQEHALPIGTKELTHNEEQESWRMSMDHRDCGALETVGENAANNEMSQRYATDQNPPATDAEARDNFDPEATLAICETAARQAIDEACSTSPGASGCQSEQN